MKSQSEVEEGAKLRTMKLIIHQYVFALIMSDTGNSLKDELNPTTVFNNPHLILASEVGR